MKSVGADTKLKMKTKMKTKGGVGVGDGGDDDDGEDGVMHAELMGGYDGYYAVEFDEDDEEGLKSSDDGKDSAGRASGRSSSSLVKVTPFPLKQQPSDITSTGGAKIPPVVATSKSAASAEERRAVLKFSGIIGVRNNPFSKSKPDVAGALGKTTSGSGSGSGAPSSSSSSSSTTTSSKEENSLAKSLTSNSSSTTEVVNSYLISCTEYGRPTAFNYDINNLNYDAVMEDDDDKPSAVAAVDTSKASGIRPAAAAEANYSNYASEEGAEEEGEGEEAEDNNSTDNYEPVVEGDGEDIKKSIRPQSTVIRSTADIPPFQRALSHSTSEVNNTEATKRTFEARAKMIERRKKRVTNSYKKSLIYAAINSDVLRGTIIKDWNQEFQTILHRDDNDKTKLPKLVEVARDFVYAAKTYGKIIILEVHLPEDQKTIKSLDMGGIAGGDKYVCHSIFFKFVIDKEIKPGLWMYGGTQRDDAASMKAAGHDLKGLTSYYTTKTKGLHYPLMALIDYRGYRLIAISIVPISKDSICYGSADAGDSVHSDIVELNEKMKRVGEILNLKPHKVNGVEVYGPGDIEGHLGKDGLYYVLDFSRVFPPEAPKRPLDPADRSIFYKMLRPEFVRRLAAPISSDAFSRWGIDNHKQNNKEAREATQLLKETVIPEFAIQLATHLSGQRPIFMNSSFNYSTKELRISELLHRAGINMRHAGLVRAHSTRSEVTWMLLTEIVARAAKAEIQHILRQEVRTQSLPVQEPYKKILFGYLKSLLVSDSETDETSQHGFTTKERHEARWSNLKETVQKKFPGCLREEEKADEFHLISGIDFSTFLTRLQHMAGFKLSKRVLKIFEKTSGSALPKLTLLNNDLLKVYAKVKHMNIIDEAEATILCNEAAESARNQNFKVASSLYELANAKYLSATATCPYNHETFYQWGKMLLDHAMSLHITDRSMKHMKESLLNQASEKFFVATQLHRKFSAALFELGYFVIISGVKLKSGHVLHEQALSRAMRYFSTAISQDSSLAQRLNDRVAEALSMIEKSGKGSIELNNDKYRLDNLKTQYLIAMNLLQVALCLTDANARDPQQYFDFGNTIYSYLVVSGEFSNTLCNRAAQAIEFGLRSFVPFTMCDDTYIYEICRPPIKTRVKEKANIAVDYQKYRVNVLGRTKGMWERKTTQDVEVNSTNKLYFRLIPTQLKQVLRLPGMSSRGPNERKQSVAGMEFEITDLDFTAWQKILSLDSDVTFLPKETTAVLVSDFSNVFLSYVSITFHKSPPSKILIFASKTVPNLGQYVAEAGSVLSLDETTFIEKDTEDQPNSTSAVPIAVIHPSDSGGRQTIYHSLKNVVTKYLVLKIIPREGATSMGISNITFCGKYDHQISGQTDVSLSQVAAEFSDITKRIHLLEKALSEQATYLIAAYFIANASPLLNAFFMAHLQTRINVLELGALLNLHTARNLLERLSYSNLKLSLPNETTMSDKVIRKLLKKIKVVATLDLSSCSLLKETGNEMTLMKVSLQYLNKITNLDISNNKSIDNDTLIYISKACINLTLFNMANLSTPTAKGIASLAALPIASINMSGCPGVTDDALSAFVKRQLKEVYISGCLNVTDKGIIALAKSNPSIESLDLSGCSMTSTSSVVPKIVQHVTKIRCLNLSDLEFSVFRRSDAFLLHLRSLITINLSNNRALSGETLLLIADIPNLQHIKIVRCSKLTEEDIKAFCSKASQLCTVDFSETNTTDNVLFELQKHAQQTLVEAVIDNCQLSESSIIEFVGCKRLQKLSVVGNQFPDVVLVHLAQNLTTLKELHASVKNVKIFTEIASANPELHIVLSESSTPAKVRTHNSTGSTLLRDSKMVASSRV